MSFSDEDQLRYSRHDLLTMKPKELIEKYGDGKSFWIKLKNQQEISFFQSGQNVIKFALGNITWQALLALPIVALFMRLLYIRRDFYYVEHLIFSIHNTSLFFLTIIPIALFDDYLHDSITGLLFLFVAIYLLFSMKRFYQQRWWKTIIKYVVATTAYTLILYLAGLVVILISFFLV
jgi:hypothetical protein